MKTRKSNKGLATMTVLAVLAGTAAVIGGVGFLIQVNNLVSQIINSLFYIIIGAVTLGVVGYFITQSRQDNIENPYAPVLIISSLAIVGMASGPIIEQSLTSYHADVQVKVSQGVVGAGDPQLEQVSVTNIRKDAPSIFSIVGQVSEQSACLVGCDTWEVDVTATCGGNKVEEQTVTGKGQQTKTFTINGIEPGQQCEVSGIPGRGTSGSKDTAYFNTE